METYKTKKFFVINYACFCSATMLTSKITTSENIERKPIY